MGYIRKALEKGSRGCMLRGGGGFRNHIFPKIGRYHLQFGFFCLFWSGFRHTTPTHITGCALGGGGGYPPTILGLFSTKSNVSERVGTVEELYKSTIMKKLGRTSLLIGSYPEW